MHIFRRFLAIIVLALLVAACSPFSNGGKGNTTAPAATASARATAPAPGVTPAVDTSPLDCPADVSNDPNCQTPRSLRVAYGVESLMQRGYTGKGQTIVDIVSYGSPTLQQDMDIFDREFGLPPITIKVLSPIGTVPFNPKGKDMQGWAEETELDVQVIHAIAPGANIVVLTSPVDELEGTSGLPQFLELEQYALKNHLGSIISQSFGASEATLNNSAGRQEVQQWDAFYKQATTQQGITFFASSGDNGATDYCDLNATQLCPRPTTSFPTDEPWVTSTGGTSLIRRTDGSFSESVWNNSFGAGGGGYSTFFPTPSYQQSLPPAVEQLLNHRRGVPDVSADADPVTGLAIYVGGWQQGGGTSATSPFWAAIAAIANQMAGHPLGFLNPALYKLASSSSYTRDFHEITVGNNSRKVSGITVQGSNAMPGWNAAAGLGTPDAENLIPDLIVTMGG